MYSQVTTMDKLSPELQQWEHIIVQWINCLEYTNPISELKEIRNGEFFTVLYNNLQNLSEPKDDIISKIYHFLKLNYPTIFCSIKAEKIELIHLKELLVSCTLLLHYTCIHDRGDMYISPLCTKLSEKTQFFIKAFLVEEPISYDDLIQIIKVMLKKGEEPKTPKCQFRNPGGDSLNSPLKDFLETPIKLSIMEEKDRRIKKLMQELQSERFEKDDMMMELQERDKKIDNLNKCITEKTHKITELRNEISMKEFKKTPHKLRQFQETERRLREELVESQNYVAQLHGEQEMTNNNMDLLTKKLESLKEETCLWQTKSLDLETKHEELLRNYKLQEDEFNSLKVNYNELKILLNELNSSNNANESASELCTETLATSIIEMQMRELEEEYSQLKSLLKDSNNNCDSLQKEAEELKTQVSELKNSKSDLECKTSNILIELDQLKNENTLQKSQLELFNKSLSDTKQTIEQRDEIITFQRNELDMFKRSLSEKNESLKEYQDTIVSKTQDLELCKSSLSESKKEQEEQENIISNLKYKIKIYKMKLNDLSKTLVICDQEQAKLRNEKRQYEQLYRDVANKHDNVSAEYDVLKKSFENLEERFDQNFLELEKLLTNQKLLDNGGQSFEDLITILRDNFIIKDAERLTLLKSNQDLKNVVSTLEKEVCDLENKHEITSKDLRNINDKLVAANEINNKLEIAIKSQDQKIEESNIMVQKQTDMIANLEDAHDKRETELVTTNKSQEDFINELKSLNETLTSTLDEYKDKMEILQNESVEAQKQIAEQINSSNKTISDYENKIHEAANELIATEIKMQELSQNILESSQNQKAQQEKFETQIINLQKKQNMVNAAMEAMKIESEQTKADKERIEVRLQEQIETYKELKYEENECRVQCEQLERQISSLKETLASEESKCAEISEVNSQSARDLVTAKINLECTSREAQELKLVIEELNEEIIVTKGEMDAMKIENEEKDQEISDIKAEFKILETLQEETKDEYNVLYKNFKNILNQWNIDSSDVLEGLLELQKVKETTQNEITHYNALLSEKTTQLEEAVEKISTNESKYENNVAELNKEIAKLRSDIDLLRSQEIACIQEIADLKEQLIYESNKYLDAIQKEKDLKIENETEKTNLQENIHDLLEKYNHLRADHKNTSEELERANSLIKTITTSKENLEVAMVQQKKKFEQDFISSAEQYYSDLKDLKSKEAKSITTITRLKEELEKVQSNTRRANEDLNKATEELNEATHEHTSLLSKIEIAVQINQKYEEMYETLKVEHENYLKESASTLLETKNDLCQRINHLQSKCDGYESEIREFQQEKTNLTEELKNTKDLFEREISSKDSEIREHLENISDLQITLNKTNEELKIIKEKISKDILAYNELSKEVCEKNIRASELECKVNQLQCGNIILETEKSQMEKIYEEKCRDHKRLEDLINDERNKFKEESDSLKEEIASLETCIVSKELNIKSSQEEIHQLQEELQTVNKVIICLNEEGAIKNKSFESQLSVIEEDHNKKLEQSFLDFKATKEKYDELNEQFIKIQASYGSLKEEFSEQSKTIKTVEDNLQQKESHLAELKIKLLDSENAQITSLQEELELKLEQAEHFYWQKQCDDKKLQDLSHKLNQATKERDDLLEERVKLIEQTESSLIRAQDNAINVKKDLISKYETHERDLKQKDEIKTELQNLLSLEKKSREFFENQALELTNEKHNYLLLNKQLKSQIERLVNLAQETPSQLGEDIEDAVHSTELRISAIISKSKELNVVIDDLERDKREITDKLKQLEKCNEALLKEKDKLSCNYEILCNEKVNLSQEKDKESKCLQNLKVQYDLLKEQFAAIEDNKAEVKLEILKQKGEKKYEEYQKFVEECSLVKNQIDETVINRNALEKTVTELKDKYINLQINSAFISEDQHKLYFNQKQTFDVIIEDILKQFSRLTKMAYNSSLRTCKIFEKTVTGILTEKPFEWRKQLMDLSVQDINEKLKELKDNSENTLQQLKTFENSLININIKDDYKKNILKENVPNQNHNQSDAKQEDWVKKYKDVKQRLILTENSKNICEKKIKQLREENKNLSHVTDTNHEYKNLLQDYIKSKENYETVTKQLSQTESICKDIRMELDNIRAGYSNLKSDYSKLEQENVKMQRLINTRGELQNIKDAYEKLFEEHNKATSEIDTLKYKRTRDREEYARLLKQNNAADIDKKIQNVKTEYELKMEKMKHKMMELYKCEMEKEIEKSTQLKGEKVNLLRTIDTLKGEIKKLNLKIKQFSSHSSLNEISDLDFPVRRDTICSVDLFKQRNPNESSRDMFGRVEHRRYSTLPRNVNFQEEARQNPSGTSAAVAKIEMEDEDELFNNKYLREMKEGITNLQQNDRDSRLSVLAYRNSLCPPHLKSSYPAETQFLNPNVYKDEDIKVGNVDLNDSMSARLLPHEKPKKKDIGTTSYKRPGPPTPSKNGGRASLQGNEQNILREQNEIAPKKLTPSRLRSLFGRNKSTAEANPISPKGKRLSIFKKTR